MNNKSHIKSYVLRTTRMSKLQRLAYKNLHDVFCIPFSEDKLILKEIFDKKKYFIEIGFGMGDATIEIAEKNSDYGYIGIEVHKPGVGKVLDEINNKNLDNLKIIEYDGVKVFENMIPDLSLDGIHIFFPDPWPKKRHHKRRLIKKEFINLVSSKLKKDAYLYITTDWEDYAHWILEAVSSCTLLENKYNGFAEKIQWRPGTKFESKGLKKNHKIWEIYFTKK